MQYMKFVGDTHFNKSCLSFVAVLGIKPWIPSSAGHLAVCRAQQVFVKNSLSLHSDEELVPAFISISLWNVPFFLFHFLLSFMELKNGLYFWFSLKMRFYLFLLLFCYFNFFKFNFYCWNLSNIFNWQYVWNFWLFSVLHFFFETASLVTQASLC